MRVLLCGVLALTACGGRDLGWLVPRATVGMRLVQTDTGVASEGFVILGGPMSAPVRRRVRGHHGAGRRLRLLGPGPRCAVVAVCRWEARERAAAIADLAVIGVSVDVERGEP